MNKTQAWIARENQYCAQNYYPIEVVLAKGKDVWLWDIKGKRYLDMMSAYSAVSFGHSNVRLIKVLKEQSETLCVTSRAFHVNMLAPFLEKLCTLSGMDMALPMNTGVEAVETAIKAARRWGYEKKGIPDNQAQIIVAKNNFHGRTLSVISFSSEAAYKAHFGPLTPGFVEIPFGDVAALKKAITPKTCAFLVEPIQGEAGIQIPPPGWLRACQECCNDNNVLFILDEVQSGLGRTGKMFAFEHEAVKPDGLILGKALGGGILPVSVFLARKEVMEGFTPGSHGSTFGGNPLAARIGLEVLTMLETEDYIARSRILGEELLQALQALKQDCIVEVRGKGLWVGVEIDTQKVSARKVCQALMHQGVLSKEAHESVIRFSPPFTIDSQTLQWAVAQFSKALDIACKHS